MKPYPLLLAPILKEKVWGGDRLARLNKPVAPGARIGESWELADLAATSADGGGGGEARSLIAGGEMRGLTIAEAIRALGVNLMGTLRLSPRGGFPLLLKYLDARENLSVQTHPSPQYAAEHPGAHLKTESWYVVDAEPGAVIYKGLKPGVTREAFEAHIRDEKVADDLVAFPARPGDFHHLPSGTVHALGAGVVIAETQTPSDTTFRVFDWGRQGRALHIAESLACIDFDSEVAPPINAGGAASATLVETPFYSITERNWLGTGSYPIENFPAPPTGGPMVWMVIRGEGELRSERAEFRPTAWRAGDTILFPAALGALTCAVFRDTTLLEVRFPVPSAG